jgi:hypothetical protein
LREQLVQLARLQEIDREITRHENNLSLLPREAEDIRRGMQTTRREIAEIQERLKTAEETLKLKERELKVEEEKIKRSEKRLLNIKNQKEYNALSREVRLGKKVVTELEEAILAHMSQADSARKALAKKEAEYAGLEATLTEKNIEVAATGEEAQRQLTSLKQDREAVVEGLERTLLKKYDTVRRARGSALAEMNNGSCSGCHMAVPPQLNILVYKQEKMVECPNCNRILYVKPEDIPEFNKMQA